MHISSISTARRLLGFQPGVSQPTQASVGSRVNPKVITDSDELRGVFAVVLNWRRPAMTIDCVKAIRCAGIPAGQIVVVENGSGDASYEELRQGLPGTVVVANSENLGFSRGVNRGISVALQAGAEFILLVNNDLAIGATGIADVVREHGAVSNVGAVTGKISYRSEPTRLWQAGGYIDHMRIRGIPRGMGEKDIGQYEEIEDTRWASGALSLIPRRTFNQVGLLPEEYFFGQEEWDYSTAILRAGMRIVYDPRLQGLHDAGKSYRAYDPILITYNSFRNKQLYADKYLSGGAWLSWKCLFACYVTLVWPIRVLLRGERGKRLRSQMAAGRLALRDHRPGMRVERAELIRAGRSIFGDEYDERSWSNEEKPVPIRREGIGS